MLCGDMHGGGRSLTAAWLAPQPMNTSYSVWPWRSVAGGYTVDARWLIRRRRRDRPGRQSFTATLTPRFAGALAQTSSQGNVFLVFAMQQTESMWNSKTVMQVVRQRWTGSNQKLASVAHHKDMNAVCKTYDIFVWCAAFIHAWKRTIVLRCNSILYTTMLQAKYIFWCRRRKKEMPQWKPIRNAT